MTYEKQYTQGKIFIITDATASLEERDREIKALFNGREPDWDLTFTDPCNLEMKELEEAIAKNTYYITLNALKGIPVTLMFVKSVQDYLRNNGR